MKADITERLEVAARVHDDMVGNGNSMAATFREAATEIATLRALFAKLLPVFEAARPLVLHYELVKDAAMEKDR